MKLDTEKAQEILGSEGIINRKGTGPCPFEATVMGIADKEAVLESIRQKMEQM